MILTTILTTEKQQHKNNYETIMYVYHPPIYFPKSGLHNFKAFSHNNYKFTRLRVVRRKYNQLPSLDYNTTPPCCS